MATVTKTIGTTGRDYSTIQAWEDDLDDSGIYSASDDAVGECYDDSDFTAGVSINGGGTIGLSSIKLTVDSGSRHDGTSGTGALISIATGQPIISLGTNYTTVEWLEIDGLDGRHDSAVSLVNSLTPGLFANNLLVHNGYTWGAGSGIYVGGYGNIAFVTNCIVYNWVVRKASGGVGGIGSRNAYGTGHFFNCTVHNTTSFDNPATQLANGFNFPDTASTTVKNCIATASEASDFSVTSFSTATVDYNASSDTSAAGANSIDSVVTADQYVSTTIGAEDLHLKAGSDCIDAGTDLGTTPTGVNIDIDGRDRDAEGDTWDISAHEFVADDSGPGVASIILRRRRRI